MSRVPLYERLAPPKPLRARPPLPRTELMKLRMSKSLHAALAMEAWETGLKLEDYVRGLLERRGKWARTVGRRSGYDLQAELPVRGDES